VGGVLGEGRRIRAAGALREVLSPVALVDHHAHGIVATPTTLDEFRGLFSESDDPRQWPHIATGITYQRAMAALAGVVGCEPTEDAVFAHRCAIAPDVYAATLLRATGADWLLIDDGFPPPGEGEGWERSPPRRREPRARCCATTPSRSTASRSKGHHLAPSSSPGRDAARS
jgi:hypothetical protein